MGRGSGAQAEPISRLDHNNHHNRATASLSSTSIPTTTTTTSTTIIPTHSEPPVAMPTSTFAQYARSFLGILEPTQPTMIDEDELDQRSSHRYSPRPIIVRDFASLPRKSSSSSKSSKSISKPRPRHPVLSPDFFHPYHALGEYDMFLLLSMERLRTGFPLPPKPMRRLLDMNLIPVSDMKRWLPMDIQALHEYDMQCARNLSRGREAMALLSQDPSEKKKEETKRRFSFFNLFSSSPSKEEQEDLATNLPAYAQPRITSTPGMRGGNGQYPYVFPAWMEFPEGHAGRERGHVRQPTKEKIGRASCRERVSQLV